MRSAAQDNSVGTSPFPTILAMKIIALVTAAVVVSFWRRPGQVKYPFIWIEDGTYILKGYAERGLSSFFEPVAGYYALVPKVIALTAFATDILYAPAIEAWLMVGFTAAVVVAVALSPTWLRYPAICALMTLTVPTHPENYTVSLYSVWWAGLLVALAVLWDTSRGYQWLRVLFVVIGGLSSPIILACTILLWLRAAIERTVAAVAIAALASAISALQAMEIFRAAYMTGMNRVNLWSIQVTFDRFLGMYPIAGYKIDLNRITNLGFIVAMILAALAWRVRAKLDWRFCFVVLLWCAAVGMSISRYPPEQLYPIDQARYFFYPDIFLAWTCIWIAAYSTYPVRFGLIAAHVLALVSVGPRLQQWQVPLVWKDYMLKCAASSGEYTFPIMYLDSVPEKLWKMTLTGDQCRSMIDRSLVQRWRQ